MLWQRAVHAHETHGRVLHVALPEGYDARAEPYPVLVCLDAQWTFGTVCDVALNLGLARLLPRVIVIGVGWHSNVTRDVVHARALSFTPTVAPIPATVARNLAHAPEFGGAPEFQHWLLDEALPAMQAIYRIDPTQRTLIGHSLSGLFGLYTLFTRPNAFTRWLLASPSSWWDNCVIFDFEARHRTQEPQLPGRVFLSVGSEEALVGEIPMRANTEALHARLVERQCTEFDSTLAILDGELHHSTIPAAVSRGLRWLYR
jgi:predicted alpha/beta superfamily hydrolase